MDKLKQPTLIPYSILPLVYRQFDKLGMEFYDCLCVQCQESKREKNYKGHLTISPKVYDTNTCCAASGFTPPLEKMHSTRIETSLLPTRIFSCSAFVHAYKLTKNRIFVTLKV